jgi:tellurite resistance protein TerC
MEALHENELPFINGGEHVEAVPEIPIWLSLAIILGTLAVTTVASLIKVRRDPSAAKAVPGEDPRAEPDGDHPVDAGEEEREAR